MGFRGVIATTPSYAPAAQAQGFGCSTYRGVWGAEAPQPPEATVVSICSLRRSGSAWELRAYRFCVSWLRPPEATESGLGPIR